MKQFINGLCVGLLLASVLENGLPNIIPIPDIIPSSAPFETDVPRCLAIYESGETHTLPASKLDILTGTKFRRWCSENGWEFKSWDEEITIERADESWKKALQVERTDTPWLVFSNGNTGGSVPLPNDADAAIELLREHTK